MILKNKIYYLSIGIILGLFTYIGGIGAILSFTISVIIYGSIFYVLYYIFHKLKKSKETLNYKTFIITFIKKISLSLIIIFILLGFFSYYQNILYPAKMPQFTITNGKKKIVFQSMSHIGTKDFYELVKNEIIKHKKDGYIYFYEGVKPGTKSNSNSFNEALGIKFDKNLYKNFSKLYGVVNQDNSIFLGLVNNKDFNVDLSLDEIMQLYKLQKEKEPVEKKELPKKIVDINKQVVDILASTNSKELKIIRFLNKALLNLIMKNDNIQNTIINNFSNKTLLDIILEKRNENIVENIYSNPANKIYISYGLMHFNGVLKLLRQKDSNWKIVNIKYFYPIK